MIVQGVLFDQLSILADRLLGEHLWSEMQGDRDRALVARCEANFVDAELRVMSGLPATVAL